jgi:hypothetical protein
MLCVAVGVAHRWRPSQAQRLRGESGFFDEFEVRTRTPLESGHLAFVGRDAAVSTVLQLVPMVIVTGDQRPESRNDCYFFNKRLEDGRIKYVSYHLGNEAEIKVHQLELQQLARDLNDDSAWMSWFTLVLSTPQLSLEMGIAIQCGKPWF